ncbi:hypothetical protein [Dongia rigui]|uniref:Uncharacterized protein n=1 Tax=Dongia rigui TaxID=940149 RepID=A0ABU5E361_9PROT|nr:hypothetical protein [Dongia rigui]MDY0873634.1 hypothetical protein [Dongia rigui]
MPTKNPNETTPEPTPREVPGEKHEQGHTIGDPGRQQQQGNPTEPPRQQGGQPNEGEGNRTAARHYNDAAQQAAQNPARTERQAQEAKRAIDSPEGDALERAEEIGKKPARH